MEGIRPDNPSLALCSSAQSRVQSVTREGEHVGVKGLTSTIFSMCFLMTVGSALGFTDTAQSSIMVGLGSDAGAGLEFC